MWSFRRMPARSVSWGSCLLKYITTHHKSEYFLKNTVHLQGTYKSFRLLHVIKNIWTNCDRWKVEIINGRVITFHIHSRGVAAIVHVEGVRHNNSADEHHQRNQQPHEVHYSIGVLIAGVFQSMDTAGGTEVTPSAS